MAKMLALSVLALLGILGTELVDSNDCCVADQFSIGFAGTKTRRMDHKKIETISDQGRTRRVRLQGKAAIDHVQHRYAVNVSWHDFKQQTWGSVQFINLINEGSSYIIKDSECFKRPACQREPHKCVPDDADLDQTMFVGMNSLQLNIWKMRMGGKQEHVHGDARFATTQENCIPVFHSLIGSRKTNTSGEYVRFEVDGVFFNYTEALPPSSFVIPDICHNASRKIDEESLGLLDQWESFREGMIFF